MRRPGSVSSSIFLSMERVSLQGACLKERFLAGMRGKNGIPELPVAAFIAGDAEFIRNQNVFLLCHAESTNRCGARFCFRLGDSAIG